MPRQRLRIILITAVICLALIAVPVALTWQQTQQERINRQLIAAVRRLDPDAVTAALERRADPNTRSNPDAPSVFVQRVQTWLQRAPTTPPEAETALNEALSAKDADSSPSGERPSPKARIVLTLLDKGADPNIPSRSGTPPLVAASRNCSADIVRLLLDHKAKINAKNADGYTALIKAALNDRVDTVQLLLQRGADVNAKDNTGSTALMCAAELDYTRTEEALLQRHADVTITNLLKLTALQYAFQHGKTNSVNLLRQHGATK